MLELGSIFIFTEDAKLLSNFYTKVFQKDPGWSDNGYYGFSVGKTFLTIGPHDKVKGKSQNPERIILNFETREVKQEFERIKDTGATVITAPYKPDEASDMWIATFADPDGNYFQLVSPWDFEK